MDTHYAVLGVPPRASLDEIQRAYWHLAAKFHPDLNPDKLAANENFKSIQQAYDVLSDPARRHSYDERLERRLGRRARQRWLGTTQAGRGPHRQQKHSDWLGWRPPHLVAAVVAASALTGCLLALVLAPPKLPQYSAPAMSPHGSNEESAIRSASASPLPVRLPTRMSANGDAAVVSDPSPRDLTTGPVDAPLAEEFPPIDTPNP